MFKASKDYKQYAESFKLLGTAPFSKKNLTIRKKLGDSLHTTVFQDIFFSLLELSPKTYTSYLYSWGKFLSMESTKEAMQFLRIEGTTKIISKLFHMGILKDKKYSDLVITPWLFYKTGIPRFSFIDKVAKTFRIELEESREAWGLPDIGKRVCFFSSSLFAGSVQAILGGQINVFESKCIASGYDHCEFAGAADLPFHKFDILTDKDLKKIRKSIFDRMFKEGKEKRTDWIHLSIPQIFYIGMSLSSAGSHTMFYWVGRKSGQEMKKRIKGKSLNTKLKNLPGLFKDLKLGMLEIKKNKKSLTFIVKESAFASGTKNLKKMLCSYLAGLFSGFLETSRGKKVSVIETKCIAKGNPHCEFRTI